MAAKSTAKPKLKLADYSSPARPLHKSGDNIVPGTFAHAELDILKAKLEDIDKQIKEREAVAARILELRSVQEDTLITIIQMMNAAGITAKHIESVTSNLISNDGASLSSKDGLAAVAAAAKKTLDWHDSKQAKAIGDKLTELAAKRELRATEAEQPAPVTKAPPKAQKPAPKPKGKPVAKTAKYAMNSLPAGGVHFFNPGTILDVSAKIRDRVSSGKGSKQPSWVAKRKPIEALPVFLKTKKVSKEVVENLKALGIL